jgi:transposase
MSRKNRKHLRGDRGETFLRLTRGVDPTHILCVSIDISKYFHLVIIHNAYGEVIRPAFEVDIYRTGFEGLCATIDEAKAHTQAEVILIGMEPTGHYFDNIARHLCARYHNVFLINPLAVKENRSQKLMHYQKTDEEDLAAIGDLLRRGEGTPYRPLRGVYLTMQQIDRLRLTRVKMAKALKSQIIGHIDRIFPGLVIKGDEAKKRYQPLFSSDFWSSQTAQSLIRVCPDPTRLAQMTHNELITAFHKAGYRLGPVGADRIIAYAKKVLLPDPQLIAVRTELLKQDLSLLETLQTHMAQLEAKLHPLLEQTPGYLLTHLKGVSLTQAASLIAAMGDPAHYQYAGQVFKRSGLISGRNDSGIRQKKGKGSHITKVGDPYLRRALLNLVDTLSIHQPTLTPFRRRLKASKPHPGVARVATARKAMGIIFAILRDQKIQGLVLKKGAAM